MADSEGTHGYFEWQVNTLMLAYDVVEPLARSDLKAQHERQQKVEHEVRDIALSIIPPDFREQEGRELTPEIVMRMTQATLRRAGQIVGLL
jgi:hypothetical protein